MVYCLQDFLQTYRSVLQSRQTHMGKMGVEYPFQVRSLRPSRR